MPRTRKPKLCYHKRLKQWYVRLNGKVRYLGTDEAEAADRYDDLVTDWLRGRADTYQLTIDELVLLYNGHVEQHYQKNGRPTSEQSTIKTALRYLIQFYGQTRARNFGPKKLKRVRQAMIEDGHCRTSINKHVGRIRRTFRWALAEELVPAEIITALESVQGLQAGRTKAVEPEPVKPVPQHVFDATLPYMSRPVAAMARLQVLTGMRPGEVALMRACDINMSGSVWEYRPAIHKTEHHRKDRLIFLGPRAQEIIKEFLKPDLQAYLFSPKDVDPKGGDRYTPDAYRTAIQRACERAFGMPKHLRRIDRAIKKVPKDQRQAMREAWKAEAREWRRQYCWHPHQLRHNAGTVVRREAGLETARTVLGHSTTAITEIYAERDAEAAKRIMARIG